MPAFCQMLYITFIVHNYCAYIVFYIVKIHIQTHIKISHMLSVVITGSYYRLFSYSSLYSSVFFWNFTMTMNYFYVKSKVNVILMNMTI